MWGRTVPLALAAAIAPALAGGAAESGERDGEARYALQGQRVQRTHMLESADGRFRLEPRLEPAQQDAQAAGAFSLRAKLVEVSATACADPNAIFSNSFE